jgi:hypothetical protein
MPWHPHSRDGSPRSTPPSSRRFWPGARMRRTRHPRTWRRSPRGFRTAIRWTPSWPRCPGRPYSSSRPRRRSAGRRCRPTTWPRRSGVPPGIRTWRRRCTCSRSGRSYGRTRTGGSGWRACSGRRSRHRSGWDRRPRSCLTRRPPRSCGTSPAGWAFPPTGRGPPWRRRCAGGSPTRTWSAPSWPPRPRRRASCCTRWRGAAPRSRRRSCSRRSAAGRRRS